MSKDSNAYAKSLRLLTYNIQAGTTTENYSEYVTRSWRQVLPHAQRVSNLDTMAQTLSDYDLVGLQEIDPGSLRSGFLNQVKYLAERAGFPYWSHQANRKVGNIAKTGNALLTRIRPEMVVDHRLPGMIKGRGALLAQFGEADVGLTVVIVHLSLRRRARASQFEFLADLIYQRRHVIVMGDMNSATDSPEMNSFVQASQLHVPEAAEHTFPSWRPERGIDHILVSDGLSVHDIQVLDISVSDHRPVAMDVELPSGCLIPALEKPRAS